MRIAQVSPLVETVPPRAYGGTERVVSYLTEELVKRGHEVTLFACAGSHTSARLIEGAETALRAGGVQDQLPYHLIELGQVLALEAEFDIVHFHVEHIHFPLLSRLQTSHLTTLHGRLDFADLEPLYRYYSSVPLCSVSKAQQAPLPFAHWVAAVHHGLPETLYVPGSGGGGYAAFLGRLSPEKRVDRAVTICAEAGVPLKVAAKLDAQDYEYYRSIRHYLKQPHVEFIGELAEKDKQQFLGDALCLLFPIDWPEPFGMVLIESLACGTPVVAFSAGSVPEIIVPGECGAVVDSEAEAAAAVHAAHTIDRALCRRHFETKFSAGRMAADYVRVYHYLLTDAVPSSEQNERLSPVPVPKVNGPTVPPRMA